MQAVKKPADNQMCAIKKNYSLKDLEISEFIFSRRPK
jgi:hypothetical protein